MSFRVSLILLSVVAWTSAAVAEAEVREATQEGTPHLPTQIGYDLSIKRLQQLGVLAERESPTLQQRLPQYDDEQLGLSFFRTHLSRLDLSNLTIPRTFFGRSSVEFVSFINTDLAESNLAWNDFISANFSYANLAKSDLRASVYKSVSFDGSILDGADLRLSTFEACSFREASMKGTILTRVQGATLDFSAAQRAQIEWRDEDGDLPDGG